jgi:hypothetical protein
MKTSTNILTLLKGDPMFGSLGRHKCYEKFINMLPPRFGRGIAFVYLRDDTLHVSLSHPGYKMELDLNKKLLLELFKTLTDNDPDCQEIKAGKIIIFNTKYRSPESAKETNSIPHYSEMATGEFDDHTDDPRLKAQFDRLKKNIQKNRTDA